jgi:hypothetical protein
MQDALEQAAPVSYDEYGRFWLHETLPKRSATQDSQRRRRRYVQVRNRTPLRLPCTWPNRCDLSREHSLLASLREETSCWHLHFFKVVFISSEVHAVV